jgi:hypothetical protein
LRRITMFFLRNQFRCVGVGGCVVWFGATRLGLSWLLLKLDDWAWWSITLFSWFLFLFEMVFYELLKWEHSNHYMFTHSRPHWGICSWLHVFLGAFQIILESSYSRIQPKLTHTPVRKVFTKLCFDISSFAFIRSGYKNCQLRMSLYLVYDHSGFPLTLLRSVF